MKARPGQSKGSRTEQRESKAESDGKSEDQGEDTKQNETELDVPELVVMRAT